LRASAPSPSRPNPDAAVPVKLAGAVPSAPESLEQSRDPRRMAALLMLSAVLGLAALPPLRGYVGRALRRPPRPRHQPLRAGPLAPMQRMHRRARRERGEDTEERGEASTTGRRRQISPFVMALLHFSSACSVVNGWGYRVR